MGEEQRSREIKEIRARIGWPNFLLRVPQFEDSLAESLEELRNQLKPDYFYHQMGKIMRIRDRRSFSFFKYFDVRDRLYNFCRSTVEPLLTPLPLGDAKPYTYQELNDLTSNFSEYSKETMHGRFIEASTRYLKEVERAELTIKTLDFFFPFNKSYLDHPTRFCNELEILLDEERPPSLMKLKGFCVQEILAIVYDEPAPMYYLTEKLYGENFGWLARMKVATQLAHLFTWLHERKFAIGDVKPSRIILDEKNNIKVYDFCYLIRVGDDGSLHLPYRRLPDAPEHCALGTPRILKADVYIFGGLLMRLFANEKEFPVPLGYSVDYALQANFPIPYHEVLKCGKRSIVDESLLDEDHPCAHKITSIAAKCLQVDPKARPDMIDVHAELFDLSRKI